MRILLVSQSILPYKGGSSIIVENLAKNFSEEELFVLGAKGLNHKAQSKPKFHYFFSELSIFGRGARFFNWFRKLRFNPLKRRIKRMVKEKNINYVIGVFPNSFYCLAACQVAKELGIGFSSYFHNTYVENTANHEKDAVSIQKEIFEGSEFVFVMSKGMQKFYEEKYQQDNFVPLVHTFNEKSSLPTIPWKAKRTYKLVAIGNFNESNIDASKRFVEAIADDDRFELSFYTHVPKMLLQQRGIDVTAIDYKGFINPDDVQEALSNYDICVLTHGFSGGYGEVEYRTIFPTRTIPFLLSGKPIIAHSPPKSFLSEFIKEHECAALVENKDKQEIIDTLEKIIEDQDFRNHIVEGAERAKEMFYGPKVAEFLKRQLAK
jgi:glycosyltransferase involved in cell wall biosynthesis